MSDINVSVIVPCYNEMHTIGLLLDAIYQQSYPRNKLEVVISDGMSTDKTRQVIEDFYKEHPDLRIKIVDNPKRNIPAALNCAIAASEGEYIIRSDAHSIPDSNYIAFSVLALQNEMGENVGGIWQIEPYHPYGEPPGMIAKGIAAAAAHPIGVGDALYRFTDKAQEVDTVPFGAFKRGLIDRVGWFNEKLLTNEDYEFNNRIRESGGRIWLDPAISSVYFARSSYKALFHQYWRYGFWKARMVMNNPKSIRWRQVIPPTFVLSLILLGILSLLIPWVFYLLLLEVFAYSSLIIIFSVINSVKKSEPGIIFTMPLAIFCMHFSWGTAFLWSLTSSLWEQNDTR
jgi:succinoglycan biosynthesis protein ExoA